MNTVPDDLRGIYEAAQEAMGTSAIKAFDAERGQQSDCLLHPCYDKFRALPNMPKIVSDLIERIASEHSAHVAAMAELNAQLESEQQAHNTIASILFAAGIETSDGTSVSAAKNAAAELAAAHAEADALRAENYRLRAPVSDEEWNNNRSALAFGISRASMIRKEVDALIAQRKGVIS